MKKRGAKAIEEGGGQLAHVPLSFEVPSLGELVLQIKPGNRVREISLGPEVGREVVDWHASPAKL
jgi:hypothetical protein